MNAKHLSTLRLTQSHTSAPTGRFLARRFVVFALAYLALSLTTAHAFVLSWDPNFTGGLSDGSGTWHGTTNWFNGTSDVAYTNGGTNIIGGPTPGVYSINVDSAVALMILSFRSNNYTLTGTSTLTISNNLILAPGANATIACPISTPGIGCTISNGATLTLGANYASSSGNPNFNGLNATNSFLYITNGSETAGGTETYNNVTVYQTGGATAFSIWNIGRTAAATYNLSGGTLRNTTANSYTISRGFPGTVNVSGNGLLGTLGNLGIAVSTTTDSGILNVLGGTVNVGTGIGGTPGVSSGSLANINLLAPGAATTYTAAAKSILTISGGTVSTKGIQFGSSVGSYANNPACQFTLSGGVLYVDANGIALGSGVTGLNTLSVTLSGGVVAATANWTGSVPMTLTNLNGDVTLQAADVNSSPFNITLSGPLSGVGGLVKAGSGTLTLSGADTYSGTTAVVNGQITMSANGLTSIGPVSIGTGTTLSSLLTAPGKSWTNTSLAITNNATLDFNFGNFQASPSSRVIQVNGNLTLDSSDSVTIEGSALITGTFPLMTCTGAIALTGGVSLPGITSLPSGVSANLSQSGKTINLVVTASPNSPLNWGPLAAGPWDFSTTDWINAGNSLATNYSDGVAVTFNDTSNSAVVITLNTNVQPVSVTANNNLGTTSYAITGTGTISGGTSVQVQGTGTLTLATSNTYTGGTIVNSGTLAINNGGDGTGPSAIGTGPLTLNAGATLDNTSGANITLNYPLPENWNGNFTFAGTTNLDLGSGTVTLGASIVQVTVLSNTLAYDGAIIDGGQHYQLVLQGPGALTLNGPSTFNGGMTLNSGKLNINNGGDGGADSAIGFGPFNINGGTIDNTSGSNLVFTTGITEYWNADFTFAGSADLDMGPGTLNIASITLTLQNGATFASEGGVNALGSGALATLTLSGNGRFRTGGNHSNTSSGSTGLSAVVNGGVVFQMDKDSSSSVHSILSLIINPNGTAVVTGSGGRQIGTTTTGTVTLSGGTLDLNGSSESVFAMTFNSGTLANGSNSTAATLTMFTNINVKSTNCFVDVTTNSSLDIAGTVIGTGGLVKLDAGALHLDGTNTYTGPTVVSNGLLSFTTATTAGGNYTVASGELEAILDPTGGKLQMTMSNLTFGTGTRMGFDLASGSFGDTTSSLADSGSLTMNGNVAVDVTNAPGDTNDDLLLTYTNRQGPGNFVAGNIPLGAYINDNKAAGKVTLTYTQPPPQPPVFTSVGRVFTSGVLTGITFAGTNGPPSGTYHILSSTNVALHPLSAWTVVKSGSFDGSGNFTDSVSVSPGVTRTFYALSVP